MARRHWLVKSEPQSYSWQDFVRERGTCWDGVRNHAARLNLLGMRRGDRVLFYHSVGPREVVGVARVTCEAHPDPTAEDPRWVAVDLGPLTALPRPVSLAAIKADPRLAGLPLVRQSRLSVMPVGRAEFQRIVRLGGARPEGERRARGGVRS
jgi:predicted RNA-binding protein with PUA-like domain